MNVGYVHVLTRAVNDARISTQLVDSVVGDDKAVIPEIQITGITLPFGDIFRNRTRLRTYEWRDTLTLDRGKHSLRVGFEVRRIFKGIQLGPPTPGSFAFASLADFARAWTRKSAGRNVASRIRRKSSGGGGWRG